MSEYLVCEYCDSEEAIVQSHTVCFYLHRILMLIKKKSSQAIEICKRNQQSWYQDTLSLPYQTKTVQHFINEMEDYLRTLNMLYEHNRIMSEMYTNILRVIKIHLQIVLLEKSNLRDENKKERVYNRWIEFVELVDALISRLHSYANDEHS